MQEPTLRDYLKVIFRQKVVVITTFIVVMITVVIGLMLKTPVYESEVKMLISAEKQVESPFYRELIGGFQSAQVVFTQSEIVKSNPVMELAVRSMGIKPLDYEKGFANPLKKVLIILSAKSTEAKLKKATTEEKQGYLYRVALEGLKDSIRIEPVRDTNLFTIKVRDYSPIAAALIANIVSRSYVIFDLEQQLSEMQMKYGDKNLIVMQLKDNIEKMTKSLNGKPLPDVEAIGPASVKIIEQASVPLKPADLSKLLILILAFFMSLFLGVVLAFLFEFTDQTFKSPQEAEEFLNMPFLGSISKNARPESYQGLSEQIYLLMRDRNLKSLLITAALPQEGVTTIITNVARYISKKAGLKVLIIDANFRDPSIHTVFNTTNNKGLADVIMDKLSFGEVVADLSSNLSVLTTGKTELNPITILESNRMIDIVKGLKENYDLVLIDCPNLREYKDAAMLSLCSDAVAVVVNEGKARRQVVKAVILPLEQKKANLIGVILNNRTFPIPETIYKRV